MSKKTNSTPEYYCSKCYNILTGTESCCPDCKETPPETGYSRIEDSFDPWLGRTLVDKYVVNKRVGRGGTGSVYRIQAIPLGRNFAIKIIDFANLPSDSHIETLEKRLHREIAALSRLRSPHIVQLYEVLDLPDQVVGVVMDYIDGQTLERLVSSVGPLPPSRALKMMRQIANGVHEAHEIGIIHRDLKPENISVEMLASGDDFAHVLDFGVVRMDDGLRITHGFLGTPLYASPEQSMAKEIDRRTDIYSLGAILFFMLTGTPPFECDTIYEILQAHAGDAVPNLTQRLGYTPHPGIDKLVRSMLAKDPDDRPNNLMEVFNTINELLVMDVDIVPGQQGDTLTNPPSLVESRFRRKRQISESIPAMQPIGLAAQNSEQDRLETTHELVIPSVLRSERPLRKHGSAEENRSLRKQDKCECLLSDSRLVDWVDIAPSALSDSVSVLLDNGDILDVMWNGDLSEGFSEDLGTVPTFHYRRVLELDDELVRLASSDFEYLTGARTGAVYSVSKEEDKEPILLFSHPDQACVTHLAVTTRKLSRRVVAFENGDVYISGKGIGSSKESRFRVITRETPSWTKIYEDRDDATAFCATHSGELFACADASGLVEVYAFSQVTIPISRKEVRGKVVRLAFSVDGHVLALLREDGVIELRHSLSGVKLATLYDERFHVDHLSFGLKGGLLGYFISDQELRAIDLQQDIIRST